MKNYLSDISKALDAIHRITETMMAEESSVEDILRGISIRRELLNIAEATISASVEEKKETNRRGLYKIINIGNGKVWYGVSENLDKAPAFEFGRLRDNEHPNKHLQNSWNKYGATAFAMTIISDYDESKDLNDVLNQVCSTTGRDSLYNYRSRDGFTNWI